MMDDDTLMRELSGEARRRQREEGGWDGRWEALTRGEVSAEEAEALRSGAEGERLHQLFAPLDELERQRMTGLVRQRLVGAGEKEREQQDPGGEPVARPTARRTVVWAVSLVAVAAAASVLLVLRPGQQATPLPLYALELGAGVKQLRGPNKTLAKRTVLVPGATLSLTMRPERAVDGPVEVRLFWRQGHTVEAVDAPVATDPGGAVRLRARLGRDIQLPSGSLRLYVTVCRPGHTPSGTRLAEVDPNRPPNGCQVFVRPLKIHSGITP